MKCNCFNEEYKIADYDKIIAIIQEEQIVPGHIIITPKEHYPIIEATPDDIVALAFNYANEFSKKLFEKMKIQGTNLIIHNGFPSQEKAHFSINILPRRENDGFNFDWPANEAKQEELNDAALFIRDAIEKLDAKPMKVINDDNKEAEKIDKFLESIRRIP